MKKLIILFLVLGFIYRLTLTSGGDFIFNMDNARDMVDVREMVVMGKLRLIGPSSAIEGFYNGPGWYYLLAVPFIVTGGHPYAAVILMIAFWAVGGYFLLKLVSKWGVTPTIFAGVVWTTSNYILLATAYSFNPNPVVLLSPLFIYLLVQFITTKKIIFSVLLWLLSGLFFNFEMNAGIFMPLIIILCLILSGNLMLIKSKAFVYGLIVYGITLAPQVLFDLKHQFIMTKSVLHYLSTSSTVGQITSPAERLPMMYNTFYSVLLPLLSNFKQFTNIYIALFLIVVIKFLFRIKKQIDIVVLVSLLIILVPFISFIFIPVGVNSWHLGAPAAAATVLGGYILGRLGSIGIFGKVLSWTGLFIFISFSMINVKSYLAENQKPSLDPAVFSVELLAVDYVYQKSQGKNFKVYTYLPSVIDYPYQYLFWWRGLSKYGYTPEDYAYLPNKPPYISQKEKLAIGSNPESSGLIYLIKQPDDIGQRHLWENSFKHLELISSDQVGPLIIETRKE